MDKQDLIDFLLTEIKKQGFDVVGNNDFPLSAVDNINKDCHRTNDYDALSVHEIRANREAILMLWQVFEQNGGNYSYFSFFADLTESPFELAYTIISNEYHDMLEAITEIYEDDLSVDIEKSQLHKYALDYISSCNELELINLYSFLDSYHLDYDLYDLAKKEFSKLLGVA